MITALIVLHFVMLGIILKLVWPKKVQSAKVNSPDILSALRHGIEAAGLNVDIDLSHDLLGTGKVGEVLYHTSCKLGKPIRTLQDIHDLLVK